MTEQVQTDYYDRLEGIQGQMHQLSQFDESSVVDTAYFGRTERSRRDALKA